MMTRRVSLFGLLMAAGVAWAAPMLRLSNTVVTASARIGAPVASQILHASNAGDGALALSVAIDPTASWLSVATLPDATCATCAVQFSFQTKNLATGNYTARVAIWDHGVPEPPQVVIAMLQVTTSSFVENVAPGTTTSFRILNCSVLFGDAECPTPTVTTSDGGAWLSVTVSTAGSIGSETAVLFPPASMPLGTYTGIITIANGIPEISVTMHVVEMATASPDSFTAVAAQNVPALAYPFLPSISLLSPNGPVPASDVVAFGTGLSAYIYQGSIYFNIDPGSLTPGVYSDGYLSIQCSAANCPTSVPITFVVVAQGPPSIGPGSVTDNALFMPDGSPGDVMIVKGTQLSLQPPQYASPPLPTTLGGATVLVNGVATPLYYSSFNQIAFQLRKDTYLGNANVQVLRDGLYSNPVSIQVTPYYPGIVAITDTQNTVISTTSQISAGQTLVIWAIGLGPTNPVVQDGDAAPNPPALATVPYTVLFGSTPATPSFVGLSPGNVGLYQVLVQVPQASSNSVIQLGLQYPSPNGAGMLSTLYSTPITVQ